MKYLGLDLGTITGWATFDTKEGFKSGSQCLKVGKHLDYGMRMLEFKRLLEGFAELGLTAVFYEAVATHSSGHAGHLYGGFLGHVHSVCAQYNIPFQGISVGTIKKHATGKGNAGKKRMIEFAKIQFPSQSICDDNQADALWVLHCGLKKLGYENKIFDVT